MNSTKDAIISLKEAIALGYNNLDHMLQDEDLENIRPCEEFTSLVELIKTQIASETGFPSLPQIVESLEHAASETSAVEVLEEQSPESIPEPVPVPDPPKFAAELEKLHGMGFANDALLLELLENTGGSLTLTVERLLNMV
eukprot:TRINITY_DN10547_c0_g1_i1.p1 TRINITY_DN10547_c0_g1~~TRINITY_DN10547_c0_g1_i1.p1  ORF type:complete len:141 (+),score=38.62 TRINITY_DN10547_c0_g1_i1:349-771(+)